MLKLKRAISILLAAAMVMSLAACGSSKGDTSSASTADSTDSSSNTESTDSTPAGEYKELTMLFKGAELLDEDHSLVIEEAAKRTGIHVQEIAVDEEKISILMAAGNMEADIVTTISKPLIEGGLIIPLDDLIEQYGPDIKANIPKTLDFSRKYDSYGKNKVYTLRSQNISYEDYAKERPFNYGVGPFIRWDYYEELGKPVVTNEDDFLNLLKQMQDKHPTIEDGKETYPMSLTLTDLWNLFTFRSLCGDANYLGQAYAVSRNSKNEINGNILQPDYVVWDTFKYYYKANQLGILDPESFTQKGENVNEKAATGRLFYTENSWNNWNSLLAESVGPEAGFEALNEAFPTAYAGDCGNYGWSFAMGISSKSEKQEDAMKWMNFMYSFDGARLLYNGIEGIHWDYDANKKPALRDETLKMYQDKELNKIHGINKFHNWIGLADVMVHPDGAKLDLLQTKEMKLKNNLEVDKRYAAHYGVEYPGQAPDGLAKKGFETGKAVYWPSDAFLMMQVCPDNLLRTATKVNDALLKVSSRMILAKDEAEFNALRDETMKKIESMGVQEIIDWTTTEYEKAKAAVATLN